MIRRSAVAALVIVAALVAFPLVAGAHVEIEPEGDVSAAGIQDATLTVPNECEGGSTTSIELNFPETPAVTTVEVTPVAGWTAADETGAGGAVTKLTLTGSLSGTGSQAFVLAIGPIPAGTESMDFTALQQCANGDVIRWVEPTPAGGEEPEHPAPVLEIQGTSQVTPSTDATPTTEASATSSTTAASTSDSDDSGSSTGVVVAVVIAVVVVVGGGGYLLIRRNRG